MAEWRNGAPKLGSQRSDLPPDRLPAPLDWQRPTTHDHRPLTIDQPLSTSLAHRYRIEREHRQLRREAARGNSAVCL